MAESISSRVAWKLRKVISGGSRDAPSRTGTATVQRKDADGTVWVRFPGSSIDTPVTGSVVANVAAGDTISYDLSGGRVSVTGNASDPAAGTKYVGVVRKAAESAAKVASKAQAIADAIGQHFFTDDNGVHVSTEKDNPTGERNILMNSLGILLRQGSSWLASFSDSAVAFYDGLGNTASNVVAQFGADGAVIGYASSNHAALDSDSFDIYHNNVEMVHFGYGEGASASGTAEAPYYTLGMRSPYGSQLKGNYSVAAGHIVEASGFASHAEGDVTIANAPRSHAEGSSTIASGSCSHAEGTATYAAGFAAHAEGYSCHAGGDHSHAQNRSTIAAYEAQTAIGKYNANSSANVFEVGNGTADDARSNAFAVAWDGTVTAAGEVKGASVSASVTLASGVAATTCTVKRSGNVVTLYVDGLNLAAELANHGSATVATVPSGYRPAYAAYAQLAGWNQGGSYVTVGTNGSVTVNNQSGAAIPTARSLGLTLTYVM